MQITTRYPVGGSAMSKLPDFTRNEMERIIYDANFTKDEETVFRMRCKGHTLDDVAEFLNVSYKTAYRINKRVKSKIIKVI